MIRRSGFLLNVALLMLVATPFATAKAADVLFDQGHGQRFLIERDGELDLSGLAEILAVTGLTVTSSTAPLDSLPSLSDYRAVVISGAFNPFTEAERQRLKGYVIEGGTLVVLLHVGPLNGQLLADFGVAVSNGVVLDESRSLGQISDFTVDLEGQHSLTDGIDQLRVYGIWALNPGPGSQALFRASSQAWMDLNRNRNREPGEPQAPFALAVVGEIGAGRFLFLGDDAIFQNRFLNHENRVFAVNLAKWLGTGKSTSK